MKKNITSQETREIFLRFFEKKSHFRIPGARLVPENDPTLLFVNSGMAPLKRYFIGAETPPAPDLCNIQPCIRTTDIDTVGNHYHLTFFEMLGSWSINNYFKARAIELAFELLVEWFEFSPDQLYATVYKGSPDLNMPPDDESAQAWEKVGLQQDHIVYLGDDNFWGPAGDFGPCGPCTEVFFDTGEAFGDAYQPGGDFDTARYIEIWNAGVFMILNKKPDGSFERLPFHSVDTGSGLERMVMSMNGFASVYETDELQPILECVAQQLASKLTSVREQRIITDHLRTSTFILAEGVVPSNEGLGYIPRRLIRKCIALVTRADAGQFDFDLLLNEIIERSSKNYPLLATNRSQILDAFMQEKQGFERVIGKGLERLASLCGAPPFTVSSVDVFTLVSTFGMPFELVRDFIHEQGGQVDETAYQKEFRKHQEISRASTAHKETDKPSGRGRDSDVYYQSLAALKKTSQFVGYHQTQAAGRILALFQNGEHVERAGPDDLIEVVTDQTPFYAEAGGQIGDQGTIRTDEGAELTVKDTIKVAEGYYIHRAIVKQGYIQTGQPVQLQVDINRRRHIQMNHSATHLLHSALRTTLGTHVKQNGSLVEDRRLRFDFQHSAPLMTEQLLDIEYTVNQFIRENLQNETQMTTYDQAVRQGALAFFDKVYGEQVRLVRFGHASAELCGGTHVSATGEIGLFRIISEGSIASGVRRIVAVTGQIALEYTLQREQILRTVATTLKVGTEQVVDRITRLVDQSDSIAGRADPSNQPEINIEEQCQSLSTGIQFICTSLRDANQAHLRESALQAVEQIQGAACLVSKEDNKVRIVVAVNRHQTRQFDANQLLQALMPLVHGQGGEKKHLAQGGGSHVSGINEIISQFPKLLEQHAAQNSIK
jgi:alanyl-tRNA synthetase